MKKITSLFFLIYLLSSCSKDEVSQVPIEIPNTQIVTQTAFTILPANPNRTMNNLVVGNKIEYAIKIENFDTNPVVVYVLKPVIGDASKHQLNNIDFYFQSLEPNDVYTNRDSITIKNSNSRMFLQILKPGTFQLEYTLQKKVLNKKVNNLAKQQLQFSAVKFNFRIFNSPNDLRWYVFSVDDGEQQFDNYLTNSGNKAQTYKSNYDGNVVAGYFDANSDLFFREQVDSNTPITSLLINEIKITQNFQGGSVNIINYNNINL